MKTYLNDEKTEVILWWGGGGEGRRHDIGVQDLPKIIYIS